MHSFLRDLHVSESSLGASTGEWFVKNKKETIQSLNPSNHEVSGTITLAHREDYEQVYSKAEGCFKKWRMMPAPKRGEIIRELGNEFRKNKENLGKLVSLEAGKIVSEGLGEVQEVIDICDFAVGLSRQLHGVTMHSERPHHRMYEQYHPLGVVGIITAFNFPMAVWAWNAALAAVCGDTMIWKPSLKTPLCAIAVQNICNEIIKRHNIEGLFNLIIGKDEEVGNALIQDRRVPLISATGSCRMGKIVGETVAKRLGRSLLELGGNNAILVMEDANLDLVTRAVLFGAVGTAGQRCTSTRRLIVHKKIISELTSRLVTLYQQMGKKIGDPFSDKTLVGPLIDDLSVKGYEKAIEEIKKEGGEILVGGKRCNSSDLKKGNFVEPTLVRANRGMKIVKEETFAPILYILECNHLDEAIEIQNEVDQGLSSSIFTNSVQSMEQFLSHRGSDCGIANVNIGTSGAEIGGAFGGEKDTGGGREAGSDSWKAYMRRQTNTINWGRDLPLAQGVDFTI